VSLGWGDLRRTVRRTGDSAAQVYPFLLRDDRLHPRIALAVEYFESMVGRPRAEMDGEVLVQFFADHRLARGVVASLAGHYRYRRQGFSDALDLPTRLRLAADGFQAPADVRAALYADLNAHHHGFAWEATRAAAIERLADRLALPTSLAESLLVLDAEDRAPLARIAAAPPTPAEVAAIYNHLVVDAVLRTAARVDLELAPGAESFVRSLLRRAEAVGVQVESGATDAADWAIADGADGVLTTTSRQRRRDDAAAHYGRALRLDRLALLGEQDAVGSWTRHGRRLVRALGRALVRHPGAVRGATALLDVRGGPYVCRLTDDYLRALAGPPATARVTMAGSPEGEVYWDPRLELAALRRRDLARGWSLRNWPGPIVYPEGVFFPEFALQSADRTVLILLADRPTLVETLVQAAPRLAARGDVLLVVTDATLPAARALPIPQVLLDDDAPLAAALAAAADLPARVAPTRVTPLDHLLADLREAGFLPLERALALAGCADEADLAGRLAALSTTDVRLVPGVGLHTAAFLGQLQAARS
jgi:hypothetical protein